MSRSVPRSAIWYMRPEYSTTEARGREETRRSRGMYDFAMPFIWRVVGFYRFTVS